MRIVWSFETKLLVVVLIRTAHCALRCESHSVVILCETKPSDLVLSRPAHCALLCECHHIFVVSFSLQSALLLECHVLLFWSAPCIRHGAFERNSYRALKCSEVEDCLRSKTVDGIFLMNFVGYELQIQFGRAARAVECAVLIVS